MPPPTSDQLAKAIQAYERQEYAQMRDICREVLSQDLLPEDRVRAHAYQGYALEGLGEAREAIQEYRRALDLHPGAWWPVHLHYLCGLALRNLGELENAYTAFRCAVDEGDNLPNDAAREQFMYALCELGVLEYMRGNYVEVLACTERASQVSLPDTAKNAPILFGFHKMRGQASFWLGRWGESISALRSALATLPESESASKALLLCYLGLALCGVQKYDEALDPLLQANIDDNRDSGLWVAQQLWLGNLYYRRNEFAKALERFERIQDHPAEAWRGSRESLARMADCYIAVGKYQEGLRIAEKAYRELRGNDLVHIEFANALRVMGRSDEARRVLEELDETRIDSGLRERFLAQSANIALCQQDRTRAEKWVARLRKQNPSSRYLDQLQTALDGSPESHGDLPV